MKKVRVGKNCLSHFIIKYFMGLRVVWIRKMPFPEPSRLFVVLPSSLRIGTVLYVHAIMSDYMKQRECSLKRYRRRDLRRLMMTHDTCSIWPRAPILWLDTACWFTLPLRNMFFVKPHKITLIKPISTLVVHVFKVEVFFSTNLASSFERISHIWYVRYLASQKSISTLNPPQNIYFIYYVSFRI